MQIPHGGQVLLSSGNSKGLYFWPPSEEVSGPWYGCCILHHPEWTEHGLNKDAVVWLLFSSVDIAIVHTDS